MRRILSGPLAVLWVVAAGGCGGGQDVAEEGLRPVVTDSAGVEIVVNRVPPTGFRVYATLDSLPDLDLGFAPGDDASALTEVAGVATLSNGDLAVANGQTLEVRVYGPDGTKVGVMGQQGFDEGEFWHLSRMGRARGDTLWVADYALHRLTMFERGSGLLSTSELPEGYSVSGRFDEGSFLLVPDWSLAFHRENPVDGVRRDPARYLRWWPAEGDTAGVGVFSHDQILVVETAQGLSSGVPPFGKRTVRAVGPGRFYVGEGNAFVIGGFDPDGTPRQSIRLEGVDLSLTPEQVAAVRGTPPADPVRAEHFERFWAFLPEQRPAYSRLILDAGGNLWVGEHVGTTAPPRNWIVFAPDGAAQGMVTVPTGFVPLEIGVRSIVGIVRGGEGGERVVRYRLTRADVPLS